MTSDKPILCTWFEKSEETGSTSATYHSNAQSGTHSTNYAAVKPEASKLTFLIYYNSQQLLKNNDYDGPKKLMSFFIAPQ